MLQAEHPLKYLINKLLSFRYGLRTSTLCVSELLDKIIEDSDIVSNVCVAVPSLVTFSISFLHDAQILPQFILNGLCTQHVVRAELLGYGHLAVHDGVVRRDAHAKLGTEGEQGLDVVATGPLYGRGHLEDLQPHPVADVGGEEQEAEYACELVAIKYVLIRFRTDDAASGDSLYQQEDREQPGRGMQLGLQEVVSEPHAEPVGGAGGEVAGPQRVDEELHVAVDGRPGVGRGQEALERPPEPARHLAARERGRCLGLCQGS